VALQGTLDTFALPDVLRLLASTKKTGRLRVSGTRGTGSVWVDAGAVVGTEASGLAESPAPVEVLFELLRYGEGSFTFEAGTTPANPDPPVDVEPLLIEAEHQVLEWREIEAVVPSMDAWVALAAELPRPEVVIDADRWKLIVSIGSGAAVSAIGQTLGLGEVAVCRMVKDAVELGIATVTTGPTLTFRTEPAVADVARPTDVAIDLGDSAGRDVAGHVAPGHDGGDDEPVAPAIEIPGVELRAGVAPEGAPNRNGSAPAVADEVEDEPADADEVARQLASLSPKAARAVAAAARAETDEEREAALAQVTGDDDEPINRGLLLKFLSSVRS